MIRIVLLGRTGNNLFQYALGRVLASKHGVPLVMDASWFNQEGWNEVAHFLKLPLKARVIRPFSPASRLLRKLTDKHFWELRAFPVIREPRENQSFDPAVLDAPADCMLFGYFQSPLYFESIATELRHELKGLMESGLGPATGTSRGISSPDAVAVHVRRGDYTKIPLFRVCGRSYYSAALDRMRDEVPSARFYIFSDDPGWCRREFTAPDTEIIDSGPLAANPLHDLRLMSLAGHHIIANSSYSWWAAWLGEKPGQQVIMPDRWYAGGIIAPVSEKRLPRWSVLHTGEY